MRTMQSGISMYVAVATTTLVLVVGGIAYLYLRDPGASTRPASVQSEEKGSMMETKGDTMMKDQGAMMEDKGGDTMTKEGGAARHVYTGDVLAGTSSPLLDFTTADYEAAKASDKLVVLYFYANWCPICRLELPSLYGAFNELATDNVVGFRVNFNDTATDADEKALAREFGVAYQHTKVFLKNGERILKAPDTWNKERYQTEISNTLAR